MSECLRAETCHPMPTLTPSTRQSPQRLMARTATAVIAAISSDHCPGGGVELQGTMGLLHVSTGMFLPLIIAYLLGGPGVGFSLQKSSTKRSSTLIWWEGGWGETPPLDMPLNACRKMKAHAGIYCKVGGMNMFSYYIGNV